MTSAARAAEERAAALEAAARLLALAMRDSHGPVDALASALERMAAALTQCARALERQRALDGEHRHREPPPPLSDFAAALHGLERDIALCIESLQFHDRLMQRLEKVSGCLTGEHRSLDSRGGETPSSPVAGSTEGSIELFE
jgi:hypothetical protein